MGSPFPKELFDEQVHISSVTHSGFGRGYLIDTCSTSHSSFLSNEVLVLQAVRQETDH